MIPRYDARSSQESYPFFYARPDSAALQELRETYRLEALTAPCDQDLCRLERVCAWVNGLWEHDGDNEPSAPDALTILGEVARGKRFRCVEFGTVVASCAAALGLPSRVVGLKTADCETREYGAGHVVTEVYLRDKRSWVMVDGERHPRRRRATLERFGSARRPERRRTRNLADSRFRGTGE